MGIHGGIEFGNRLLSIVVGIVAVAARRGAVCACAHVAMCSCPAVAILALTGLQGFVGGISVLGAGSIRASWGATS